MRTLYHQFGNYGDCHRNSGIAESEPERIIELETEICLDGLKPAQIIFLPVVIEHNKEFPSGLQDPAEAALQSDVP
jgi:hypothetical protein